MTARPTALAVVVVVAAGVATGAAFGGRTETKTRTVTVAASAETTTDPTAAPAAPAPPAELGSADVEPTPGFDPLPLDDGLVTVDDTTSAVLDAEYDEAVSLTNIQYGVPAQLQQGPEHDDAMTFDFESSYPNGYAADYYQFEITVPDQATTFVSTMGFLKGEATGNRVKVAFYKNEYEEGEQLKQNLLESASETAPVRLVVRGISKLIVRLTCKNRGRVWKTPDDDVPSFGFVAARFQ